MDEAVVPNVMATDGPETEPESAQFLESENSPSSTEQEVNKPLVDEIDTDKDNSAANESDNVIESNSSETTDQITSVQITNGKSNELKKKVKRNVSFPDGSGMVMSYLDPPNPWKNVPNWKTEDLIKAYKKSCEKHGTKPLNKILSQLQCIENVGERYEILSLKGERLDMKQCESLEEIFRHVRFRCVDVEATHLDDEMAVSLFEMVEYYESACKLNISFNKGIGPRGWQSCSRLVRKTPCLIYVDARSCDLNERVLPIMGRAFRMGCYLTTLQLQNANLTGRALVILVAALRMNENLKELFIGDNKFMPTDGVPLGNLLKSNHKLELLDLRNNHLQDVGIGHLCNGLSEQTRNSGLLTLVLWNNQVTFQGMAAINKALTLSENLETLNLGRNPITNEGIHVLKDGLLKTKTLLKLGLPGTKVSCEGAVALAEAIADSPRLVRLDLQDNDIKTAGLMALSLALKMNDSLTRLDIDRDTKKESGVKDYAEQQRRLQQDIASLLDRNRDLSYKQEQERKQIEEKNRENARKLAEAAKDLAPEEETSEYIRSEDTIHRPKILFLPFYCPEQELDSPGPSETFLQNSSPNSPHLQVTSSGSDLLSPQYCQDPQITAKKIFSVTRVTSPTLTSPTFDYNNSTNNTPHIVASMDSLLDRDRSNPLTVPQLCTPLSTVQLPNSSGTSDTVSVSFSDTDTVEVVTPTSMQRAIEDETMVKYIQQIVGQSEGKVQLVAHAGKTGAIESNCILINMNASNNVHIEEMDKNSNAVEVNKLANQVKREAEDVLSEQNEDKNDYGTSNVIDTNTINGSLPESESSNLDNVSSCIKTENTNNETSVLSSRNEVSVSDANKNNSSTCNVVETKALEKQCVSSIQEEYISSNVTDTVDIKDPQISETDISSRDNKKVENKISELNAPESNYSNDAEMKQSAKKMNIPKDSNDEDAFNVNGINNLRVENNSECENGVAVISSQSEHFSILNCDLDETSGNKSCASQIVDIQSVDKAEDKTVHTNNDLNDEFVDCKDSIETEEPENIDTKLLVDFNSSQGDQSNLKESATSHTIQRHDSEQWNTVNKSDIGEKDSLVHVGYSSDTNANTNKPDFFSNLSLNGLKQELASMIDEEGNQMLTSPVSTLSEKSQHTSAIVPNGGESTTDWYDTAAMDTSS